MLGDTDLSDLPQVESLYRSVEALSPGEEGLDRDASMKVLRALEDALQAQRDRT